MTLPCPAASRPKVPLLATWLAGIALLFAHPAHAADDHGGKAAWTADAPRSEGWQYSSSAVSESVANENGPPRPWAGHDYHFAITHGPTYPATVVGGGIRDEAVRASLTLRWW